MVPLILGQVWGKGKWLGGKSLFLSELGFVVFFFFFGFFSPHLEAEIFLGLS